MISTRHSVVSPFVSPFRPNSVSALRGLALAAVLALAGCSGGGSSTSGAIEGLSVADSMSVITAPDGSGSSATSGSVTPGAIADTSGFDADCDYNTDAQQSYVYDPSMKTLALVNQILCMVSQTGYAELVNEGDYKAQVDEAKCEVGDESGSSSEQGQSSGSNAVAPNVWTVHSARASNGADQIVEFWIPDTDQGDTTIWVRMVVSEGATPENPFGVFTLSFAGVPNGGTIDDAQFFGALATLDVADGFIGFSFYEEEGDITQVPGNDESAKLVQANVNMFADQTQGVAYIHETRRSNHQPGGDTGPVDSTYAIAFDQDNVLRSQDGAPGVCLSRSDFNAQVWSYNLYDATTGDRIDRNSGFGFRTQDGGYGWIGYYGMWAPPGVDVETGDTVTRDVYGQATADTYTVLKAPGKLIQNVRQTLALVELEDEQFNWWNFQSNPPAQYRVEYHGGDFQLLATWNEETHAFEDLPQPAVLDTSVFGVLGMYSDSLGGPVSYVDGDEFITYWSQSFVNGSSELFTGGNTLTLYGYTECLRAGITGADAQNGDVFSGPQNDPSMPYEFVFDKDTLTLYATTNHIATDPIGLAQGESVNSGPFTWGMRTGPLVTDTTGYTSTNQIWSANVFYTWETGPNSWNQYASLVDSLGDAVFFDAPLQFRYTHETGNDRNADSAFNGRDFQLGYDGPGNLHGIPSMAVDLDGDMVPDRYYPVFSLEDGVLVGPTGTEYIVKGVRMELTLDEALDCSALNVDTVDDLPLPSGADFVVPDNGPAPEFDEAPRVIEGHVQGADPE